jgi:hypothetical protein
MILYLSNGNQGLAEIKNFLEDNYDSDYTLSIYDLLSEESVDIECSFDDIFSCIALIVNMEHDFPEWIGKNELAESFVVGMNFTRGTIKTLALYKYSDGKLEMQ